MLAVLGKALQILPEALESVVRLRGVEDRARLILVAPLESLRIQERVDAVFMGEVFHRTSPQLVLRAASGQSRQDGFLVLAQTVLLVAWCEDGLLGRLVGALRPPPTSSELRSMLRVAG